MDAQAGMSIKGLLRKTEHYDKDERYMATSDLCEMLKKHQSSIGGGAGADDDDDAALHQQQQQQQQQMNMNAMNPLMDKSTERQVCTAVLRLLHDKSNDVQAIAVKTLGVLLSTVGEQQILEIADSLADQVLDAAKSELRDVYAIGLRTLCKTCPSTTGDRVAQRLTGRLLDGIRTASSGNSASAGSSGDANATATANNNNEIILACLDVLTDLLSRFGSTSPNLQRQHEAILQMCLSLLSGGGGSGKPSSSSASEVVRKRAGNTLACLSVCLSDALLMRMVESLLTQIDKGGLKMDDTDKSTVVDDTTTRRALIRTMCTVSGAVGHRLGQEHVDRILPIFLRFTNPAEAATGDDDDENGDHAMMQSDSADSDDEAAQAAKNELRESCFVGFESFVAQCPLAQIQPHLDKIVQASLAFMAYDPNYSYGVADGNEEGDDDNDDEYEDEEEDEYEEEDDVDDEDDDDESWKVRRGAVRALKAIIEALRENPASLWTKEFDVRGKTCVVAFSLVERFNEREENCRVGLIDCFNRLLQVTMTAPSVRLICESDGSSSDETTTMDTDDVVAIDLHKSEYASKVVKACEKMLSQKKGKEERSKSSALTLLATFCKVPGGIGGQAAIGSVFSHVQPFLATSASGGASSSGGTNSKALRLDTLSLLHTLLASGIDKDNSHSPIHIRTCLVETSNLLPELCSAVNEQWYKVIAEALRALAFVPPFFRDMGYSDADSEDVRSTQRAQVAEQLYEAMEPLLAAHDVDQEIKECALRASASLLSNLHASLKAEHKDRLLSLLLERLKNETTRVAAIKNLALIAGQGSSTNEASSDAMDVESSLIDLSPILADSIAQLSSFLKLPSRSLKQTTLEAMDVLVTNHGSYTQFEDGELFSSVCKDFAPLLVDSDLHLSHLTLRCTVSILQACAAAGPAVKAHVMEPAMALATSSQVQDLALESLLLFFKQVIASDAVEFEDQLFLLRQRLDEKVGKQGIYNLAKCIATIIVATTPQKGKGVLEEILALLESSTSGTAEAGTLRQVQLGLLITGDLGRMVDLSSTDKDSLANGAAKRLKPLYMSYFESPSEELKHAAAYALGNAAVGAHESFIPAIVSQLDEDNKKQQYLLLSALRGFIQCSASAKKAESLTASLPEILPLLEKHCSEEEEGVRTMVAECLGSLTCIEPAVMLKKLADMQTAHFPAAATATAAKEEEDSKAGADKDTLVCWTVATAVKLAISGRVDATELANHMPTFVKLLDHKDLQVRNAALLAIYSAVHHMPQAVSGLLQESIFPALFEVSKLKLQRMVDFGPFKHWVDDALPLRKTALSIFATCLETLPGTLDVAEFMPVLAKSLGDSEDIQLHAHQIVISMCSRRSTFLVSSVVDTFVEPLDKTLKKKPGTKTGTELERLNDWIKSALRVMLALSKLDGVMASRKFSEFVGRVKSDPKYTQMLQSLQEES